MRSGTYEFTGAKRRYPLQMRVHYRVVEGLATLMRGSGTTVTVGSTEIRFRSPRPLPEGAHVALVIEWPARFGGLYPLELCVAGTLGPGAAEEATVRIASWHFRVTPEGSQDSTPGWGRPCHSRGTLPPGNSPLPS